jgi:hypothetical protein
MGHIDIERAGRMVLNPLTEVCIRMFVPIRIGCGQLMVHILGNGKGSDGEEQQNETGNNAGLQRP